MSGGEERERGGVTLRDVLHLAGVILMLAVGVVGYFYQREVQGTDGKLDDIAHCCKANGAAWLEAAVRLTALEVRIQALIEQKRSSDFRLEVAESLQGATLRAVDSLARDREVRTAERELERRGGDGG